MMDKIEDTEGLDYAQMKQHITRGDHIKLPNGTTLHEHSHDNDFMLLASATNSVIVKPIAERLGFKNIIATEVEIIDDKYTGNIVGESALGSGKLNKVKEWMNKHGFRNFENTTFYSDSINDLPLLSAVSNPIGVNPDEQLRAICWESDWEIIELPIH